MFSFLLRVTKSINLHVCVHYLSVLALICASAVNAARRVDARIHAKSVMMRRRESQLFRREQTELNTVELFDLTEGMIFIQSVLHSCLFIIFGKDIYERAEMFQRIDCHSSFVV